jgi:hypothetical protein
MCVCVNIYIYIYIYIYDWIESIYVLPLLLNNMASETLCTQIGSGAKCWLAIYHWSAGLAVTGRILDIGQNVLQSSFRGGSCNTLSYFQIFLLIAFLQEAFIRNIMIGLWINHTIIKIMCINNKEIVNNKLWKAPVSYFALQNQHGHAKVIGSLDARPETWFASRDIDLRFRSNETRKWASEGHLDDNDSGTCHSTYLYTAFSASCSIKTLICMWHKFRFAHNLQRKEKYL